MPEQEQGILDHPFAPEACWKFAISRPFNNARVATLLHETVLPILRQRGLPLECSYASDDIENENFWMNRMKVILEVADVHIFFGNTGSHQVEFEEQYSRYIARKGRTPSLDTNFRFSSRKYRILAPSVIAIREGRSFFDRPPLLSWKATVHYGQPFDANDFGRRFEQALNRAISIRKRRILRGHKWDETGNRLIARMRPRMMAWTMKMVERKAQADPQYLAGSVGTLENARAQIEAHLESEAATRHRRRGLDVKRTLIHESALAQKIAETPGALFSAGGLKPMDHSKILSDNEMEAYLHQIRTGKAEFKQSFFETYKQERAAFHAKLLKRVGPKFEAELQSDKWLMRLEKLGGFLNALKYRKRIRQSKGHVIEGMRNESQDSAGGAGSK